MSNESERKQPLLLDTACANCGEEFRALMSFESANRRIDGEKINENNIDKYAHCYKVECLVKIKYNIWKENPIFSLDWHGLGFSEVIEYYDKEYGHIFEEVIGENWKEVCSKY